LDRTRGRVPLALASLAATLLLAEVVLRAWPRAGAAEGLRALHEVRPGRPWLYGLRPGARATLDVSGDVEYVVNAQGFRDREYTRAKPAGVRRILVFGDSLAFGYGVALEDTFPKRLESLLGSGWEVLNFGVGGYNPYNEAALLEDVGASFAPDLVLAQFCVNDLNDPLLHFDAQTRLHLGQIPDAAFPDPGARERRPRVPAFALELCRELRLCALVDDALLAWRAGDPDPAALRAALAPRDGLGPGPERRWLQERYTEMAETARGVGARFAVLAFPHRDQVEGDASARLQADLVGLGAEGGWTTLDLLPAFLDAARASAEPLFLDAWHPSAAGHRVAAEAIVAELARRGLPPQGS
jgi:lysophospholipase L1-like esterase